MSEDVKPWDQSEDEPNRWYQRFETFRLMGPGRSILEAANQEKAKKGKDRQSYIPGSWSRASETWQWKERAEAWDKHLSDEKAAAIERANAEAAAEIEAQWKAKIMGPSEVLGRLSEQGRISIGDFITNKQVPVRTKAGNILTDKDGSPVKIDTWDIDLEMVKLHGHLIKSISATLYGPKIELHDGQSALVTMGKHLGLLDDRATNINIDLSQLSEDQLERIANGEDPVHVLATSSESGN